MLVKQQWGLLTVWVKMQMKNITKKEVINELSLNLLNFILSDIK